MNIRIYSDATICTERISEYIRMPQYVPNEYPNIFGCNIFTEGISEYIRIPEIARIRIQIKILGHFIRIFKYSYSSLVEEFLLKGSLLFYLNKMLHWIFFCINYI